MGTINVSIAPLRFRLLEPDYIFTDVKWTESYPPETFSFAHCLLTFEQQTYQSWIYYPHPETKISHFHSPSLIEIITQPIENLAYGADVDLVCNPRSIELLG